MTSHENDGWVHQIFPFWFLTVGVNFRTGGADRLALPTHSTEWHTEDVPAGAQTTTDGARQYLLILNENLSRATVRFFSSTTFWWSDDSDKEEEVSLDLECDRVNDSEVTRYRRYHCQSSAYRNNRMNHIAACLFDMGCGKHLMALLWTPHSKSVIH